MSIDYRGLFDLKGRTALVIGAGSGIGRASAEGLSAFGAHVVCADVREDAAASATSELLAKGGSAEAMVINIADEESVREAVHAPERLDVVVCSPSINVRKPLANVSAEEFDKVVGINLRGSFFVVREAGTRMAAQGKGSLIFFSSIRSQTVEPGQGIYAATKAGTLQMIRAAAAEWGKSGVRANAVAPGVVETPLTQQIKDQPAWYDAYAQKSALGRWAQPSELVGAVIYLASDASSFVTGSLMVVDGGWTAVDGRFTPPL